MQNRVSSAWDSSGITKEERGGVPVAADATEMPREPDEERTTLTVLSRTVARLCRAFGLFGVSLLRRGAVLWHGGEGGGGCGVLTPS